MVMKYWKIRSFVGYSFTIIALLTLLYLMSVSLELNKDNLNILKRDKNLHKWILVKKDRFKGTTIVWDRKSSSDLFKIDRSKQNTRIRENRTKTTIKTSNSRPKELPFRKFQYPMDIDLIRVVRDIRSTGYSAVRPINSYPYHFSEKNPVICKSSPFTTFVVKSAYNNFERRQAIRETWGNRTYLENYRFKIVFVLGEAFLSSMQPLIEYERDLHHDIIQYNFQDTYFNNTLKTIGALKWLSECCNNTQYAVLVDDDFYVNNNLLYQYLSKINDTKALFMGRVWYDVPQRDPKQKWYMPVSVYPFKRYPPFISAGFTLMSIDVAQDFNIGRQYTKQFKFDDVYLAIIAYKLGIKPMNLLKVTINKSSYRSRDFRRIVASHGYSNVKDLTKAWNVYKNNS